MDEIAIAFAFAFAPAPAFAITSIRGKVRYKS
jgi:hypothetical protein